MTKGIVASVADPQQLELLRRGVEAWNRWRTANPTLIPDLQEADLRKADLRRAYLRDANLIRVYLPEADLRGADLGGADLRGAHLHGADLNWSILNGSNLGWAYLRGAYLREANLSRAHLREADLREADLRGADLSQAYLPGANLNRSILRGANLRGAILSEADLRESTLSGTDLSRANLRGANLGRADLGGANLQEVDLTATRLIGCRLKGSNLTGSRVYGVSVWDTSLAGATQRDLIITPSGQPSITVDNLEVAQFVYLLLNNARIREVIDTITSKAVLILGRFTSERKRTLDALRDALRARNYLPIVFDFEKPVHRDFTETVSTLAHLSRFVIADLTDPRSIPQELTAIVPRLLSVPVQPLLLGSQREWAMFSDLARYPQVIEPFHYTDDAMLLSHLETRIIEPAEQRARELVGR